MSTAPQDRRKSRKGNLLTAVTPDLVDAKGEAVKAECRLELAQAVSGLHAAIEKQNAVIKEQGAEFRIAIEKQNAAIEKQNAAIEKQGAEFRIAIEKQNAAIEKQNAAIEKQGAEHTAALAKHSSALDRRLTTNTYWMFATITAGYLALFGAAIAFLGQLASS